MHRGLNPDDVRLSDALAYFQHREELVAEGSLAGLSGQPNKRP